MNCPQCQSTNPPEAVRCAKCDTPFDAGATMTDTPGPGTMGAETLEPRASGAEALELGTMKVPDGWSVPAPVTPGLTGSLADLQPGTLLGSRYEILKLLGHGGMGAVYQAKDRELDRVVALKVIRPDLAGRPDILQRFKQELILARQVTHKNVIRIFDLGEADGIKFITMQFIEGQDLKTLLVQKGKFAVEEAVGIVQQVCLALEAAHAEGVVHRDLKPQNIMVDEQGKVSVMDFGIARSVEFGGMTQTGALMGTPEYMSPEQVRGERVDARSDLFTLGIILCELLTGQMPYQADTTMALMFKRTQERAVPPAQLDPSVPQPVSDIVAKCLEIDPSRRYQSAQQILNDLEIWQGTRPGTIVAPTPFRLRPFPLYWKWIAAGLMVVVLAVGLFALRTRLFFKPAPKLKPVTVLVADLTNATADPLFDGALEPTFVIALEGESFINAYDRGQARKAATQLQPGATGLNESQARLIAVREGINVVVSGSIVRQGNQYNISCKAMDAMTGRAIAISETTAASKDAVLRSVDKLAARVRTALGDATPESVQLA